MMRGFVKKLAFTMALSMVVTTAAPAGSAFAAKEFTYAHQKDETKSAVTVLNMKAGDEVDLRFIGVKDYKNYELKWKSADEKVATVDKNGVIKAEANGVTTVELKVGDGSVYTSTPVIVSVGFELPVPGETVTPGGTETPGTTTPGATETPGTTTPDVTVTPDKPVEGYFEAVQTTEKNFKMYFSSDMGTNFKKEDIYLYRVYKIDDKDGDGEKDEVFVDWSIEAINTYVDETTKNTVIDVQTYINFNDGDLFFVTLKPMKNDEKDVLGQYIDMVIADINCVEVGHRTFNEPEVAYSSGEDAEVDIPVTLTYRLFHITNKGVKIDLTNVYASKGTVDYIIYNENDDIFRETEDTIVFKKPGLATEVVAQFTFENAEYEEQTEESEKELIVAKPIPAYNIESIVEWTIIKETGTIDWNKVDHDIPADWPDYKVAVLVRDIHGNLLSTHNCGDKYNGEAVINLMADEKNLNVYMESVIDRYELKFYSTANDKFLVDEEGNLETYTSVKRAVIYVALHDTEKDDDTFVRNIGAIIIEIQEEGKLNSLSISSSSEHKDKLTATTLVTKMADDANGLYEEADHDYTTATIHVQAKDQYSENYDGEDMTYLEYVITTNDSAIKKLAIAANGEGEEALSDYIKENVLVNYSDKSFVVDATVLRTQTQRASISFTITVKEIDKATLAVVDKASNSFRVSLQIPEIVKDEFGDETVVVESWSVETANGSWHTHSGESSASIIINKLSNNYKVGHYYYNLNNPDRAIQYIESASYAFTKKDGDNTVLNNPANGTDDLVVGDIFVTVVGPDKKVVPMIGSASGSAITVSATGATNTASSASLGFYLDDDCTPAVKVAAPNSNGELEYLKEGKYTVKVMMVSEIKDNNEVVLKTRTAYFNVTDDNSHLKFKDMVEVETHLDGDTEDDIKKLIVHFYKFNNVFAEKHGGYADWKIHESMISNISYTKKGDRVIINSIEFHIPCDGSLTLEEGEPYYVSIVKNINRSIRFNVSVEELDYDYTKYN